MGMSDADADSLKAPTAGKYRIDPERSRVGYSSKHMFGLGTVHAAFSVTSGDLEVADPVTNSKVSVIVDAASFTSDSAKRDRDVKSKGLLNVATYPEITFTSSEVRTDGGRWVVLGVVTAHGTTAPVEVIIDRINRDGDDLVIQGRVEHIDRLALGVTGSRGMVGRYLDLEMDAVAVPA
jgi:polyisoprenoid-binding protein YceI